MPTRSRLEEDRFDIDVDRGLKKEDLAKTDKESLGDIVSNMRIESQFSVEIPLTQDFEPSPNIQEEKKNNIRQQPSTTGFKPNKPIIGPNGTLQTNHIRNRNDDE